jgi:hypothetical protein
MFAGSLTVRPDWLVFCEVEQTRAKASENMEDRRESFRQFSLVAPPANPPQRDRNRPQIPRSRSGRGSYAEARGSELDERGVDFGERRRLRHPLSSRHRRSCYLALPCGWMVSPRASIATKRPMRRARVSLRLAS